MTNTVHNSTLFLAGPTGVGKSLLAAELAIQLGGEIVCGDAFQIYRGISILTAQPPAEMLARVPHHLYGSVSLQEEWNAARYAEIALPVIADIAARGRVPIVVGGSGLYLDALCGMLDHIPPADPALRTRIAALSLDEALAQLQQADPTALSLIDTRNPRRVTRALEIVLLTGKPLSHSRRATAQKKAHGIRGVLLTRDKENLSERIASNVRQQFANGVVAEVASISLISSTAARAIGFSTICDVVAGLLDTETAIASITLDCMRYAKRQLTWFRNQTSFPHIEISPAEPMETTLTRIMATVFLA